MKYVFRGITVFVYDKETKQVTSPDDENYPIGSFNHCRFIPQDYLLISQFFERAFRHAKGLDGDEQLQDIIVN